MTTLPVNKKTVKGIWKMTQVAGLAFAIPFEIAVGPLIGYFICAYLRNKFGLHRYIMYIFILMGFVASLVNVAVTIEMMIKINKEKLNIKES
jgi:F0F1-type ATP synthase assembly protein I